MQGKKILAGVLGVLILVKIILGLVNPATWMGLSGSFLEHRTFVLWVYLVVLVVSGYYVFTSLDLIDIAVVMLFTSTLTGFTLMPYSESMLKFGQEIGTQGFGRAWLALIFWVALAGAVLYRVFATEKER
ncbi:MAG: hypothetical protein P8168_14695 [Deltaproteobacteria bacterium]